VGIRSTRSARRSSAPASSSPRSSSAGSSRTGSGLEHHHLGPLRLHAAGCWVHARPLSSGRRPRGLQTMDERGKRVEGQERGATSASTTSTRTSTTSSRASPAGRPGVPQREQYLTRTSSTASTRTTGSCSPAGHETHQPLDLQEHQSRHLDGHEEHGLRRHLQHEPTARAAVLRRVRRGARRPGHPRQARAQRHRCHPGAVRPGPLLERPVRVRDALGVLPRRIPSRSTCCAIRCWSRSARRWASR